MTARIIGAFLVIIGCSGIGILVASAHRNQTKTLRQFIMLLNLMECELAYRHTALPDLCRQLSNNSNGVIMTVFSVLSKELEKQISPDVEQCMHVALKKAGNIPPKVTESFLLLGQSLGRFDLEGQLKGIEMTKSETQRILQEYTDNQDSRIRCYQTLSICAGAAVAILFI